MLSLAALTGAGSGCGSEKEEVSLDTVATAAENTAKTRGARLSFRGTVQGSGLPGKVGFSGNGTGDVSGGRGELQMKIPNPTGTGEPIRMEMVFDRLTFYMTSPLFENELPSGKEWLKFDLAAASKAGGIDISQFGALGGNDPLSSLKYLRAVSGDVTRVGEEKVRGVTTTRYRATTDLRKYPRLLPKSERSEARASAERLIRVAGASRFPVEVWIDEKDLVRRQRVRYSSRTPQGRMKLSQDIELYDFGVPVRVRIPSDDETFDATKLAGRALRQQAAP